MLLESRKNQAGVAVGHTGSVLTITQQKNTANRSRTRLAAQRHWAPAVQIELNPGATPRAQQQGLDTATRTMQQGAAEDEFGGSPKKQWWEMVVKTQKVKANKWRNIVFLDGSSGGTNRKFTQQKEGNMDVVDVSVEGGEQLRKKQ